MISSAFSRFSWLTVFAFGSVTVAALGCASAPNTTSDENPSAGEDGDDLGASEDALTGKACGGRRGNTCGAREYCNFSLNAICGRADAQGVCAKKPNSCTSKRSPVCGCDGVTYRNACTARANGHALLSRGACPTVPTTCSTDAECTNLDIGPNAVLCIAGTAPTKACGQTSTCGWSCKPPVVPAGCSKGQKQCMMCGAPPPDGICRAFICVPPTTECPLVP
jgi:Kazal-type serine protease inhibitor domain